MSNQKGSRIVYMITACMVCYLLTACSAKPTEQPLTIEPSSTQLSSTQSSSTQPSPQLTTSPQRQELLYRFVVEGLSGDGGVHTNWRDTDQAAEVATGHELLSESAGLLLSYYVLTDNQQAFDKAWQQAQDHFDSGRLFSYRYSPAHEKRYPVNALVDDMRLLRVLYDAAEKWDKPAYKQAANQYGERLLQTNADADRLYDFYDEQFKVTNRFLTLCYIDLRTLRQLVDSANASPKLLEPVSELAKNGFLGEAFPFYETRYDYELGKYTSETIRTVESLLTILHLTEVGSQEESSIAYLKQQLAEADLYGEYDRTGKPLTDIRSTAIYALVALIGAELDDAALYRESLKRMEELQVLDEGSPLYGGYGDTNTEQAYSFDNLLALLAYASSSKLSLEEVSISR